MLAPAPCFRHKLSAATAAVAITTFATAPRIVKRATAAFTSQAYCAGLTSIKARGWRRQWAEYLRELV